MFTLQNFFMAPTFEQRQEIKLLCQKGQSDCYLTSYIQSPIQAITSIIFAVKDVPWAPLKGLFRASIHIVRLSFKEAGKSLISGLAIGMRSLLQLAVIIGAVFIGFILPQWTYSTLERINTLEDETPINASRSDHVEETATDVSSHEKATEFKDPQQPILDRLNSLEAMLTEIKHGQQDFSSSYYLLKEKESEIGSLQTQLNELQAAKEDLSKDLQQALTKHMAALAEKQENVNTLQALLTVKDNEISAVQTQLQSSQHAITELRREIETLKQEKSNSGENKQLLEIELKSKDDIISSLRQAVVKKDTELAKLTVTIQEKDALLGKNGNSSASLLNRVEEQRGKIKQLTTENASLKKEKSALLQQIETSKKS